MANQHEVSDLSYVSFFYDQQTGRKSTPVARMFFDPKNIVFLQQQLEEILQAWTGDNSIRVPITDEFIQTMYEVCSKNEWLAYSGVDGLKMLNNMVLNHEAKVQYSSLRHRKLFYKYFIHGDRMRVFPYGEPTKVMKGDTKVVSSGYMLTNPHKKSHPQFLKEVLNIGNPESVTHRVYPEDHRDYIFADRT